MFNEEREKEMKVLSDLTGRVPSIGHLSLKVAHGGVPEAIFDAMPS